MNTQIKHTPGPWVTNKNAVVPCIYGPDDNLIATIHPHRKRDINLIAAAPAMYEALRRIKVLMESGDIEGKDWMEYGQIVQALAQAEGAHK